MLTGFWYLWRNFLKKWISIKTTRSWVFKDWIKVMHYYFEKYKSNHAKDRVCKRRGHCKFFFETKFLFHNREVPLIFTLNWSAFLTSSNHSLQQNNKRDFSGTKEFTSIFKIKALSKSYSHSTVVFSFVLT